MGVEKCDSTLWLAACANWRRQAEAQYREWISGLLMKRRSSSKCSHFYCYSLSIWCCLHPAIIVHYIGIVKVNLYTTSHYMHWWLDDKNCRWLDRGQPEPRARLRVRAKARIPRSRVPTPISYSLLSVTLANLCSVPFPVVGLWLTYLCEFFSHIDLLYDIWIYLLIHYNR